MIKYFSLCLFLISFGFSGLGQTIEELIDTPIQELREKQIYEESEIIDTYFKGTEVERLMKSGSRNKDLGAITMTGGALFTVGVLVFGGLSNSISLGSGSSIDGKYPLAGVGFFCVGVLFRSQGNKKIERARNAMSKSGIHYIGNRYAPELNFGTTNNGIGLILSF